ncbi:MAG: PAS domain S-box-containing protein [Parasphingorhabdus sp.]
MIRKTIAEQKAKFPFGMLSSRYFGIISARMLSIGITIGVVALVSGYIGVMFADLQLSRLLLILSFCILIVVSIAGLKPLDLLLSKCFYGRPTDIEIDELNYQQLFENTTAGIGRTDSSTGRLLFSNPRLAEIFGYDDVDEFIREFIFSEHYPDVADREKQLQFYRDNPGSVAEGTFTGRHGNLVYVQAEVRFNEVGGYVDFVIIDITQKRQTEIKLSVVQSDYKALFENSTVGIGRSGIDNGKLLLGNQRLAEIFGYENPDEMMENFEFIPSYVDKSQRKQLIINLQNGAQTVSETSFYQKNGGIISLLIYDAINEEQGWLDYVAVDITELKQIVSEKRELENVIKSLIEYSPVPISVKDLDGVYSYLSPAYSQYLNQSIAEVSGQTVSALFDGETEKIIKEADDKVVSTGMPLLAEESFRINFGESILQVSKFPVKNASGDVSAVATIGIDVTSAVKNEQDLLSRTETLSMAEGIALLGHWRWDDQHKVIEYCSDHAARLFGLSSEQFLATASEESGFMSIVHVDDRQRVSESRQQFRQRVTSPGAPPTRFELEYRVIRSDGEIRFLHETEQLQEVPQSGPAGHLVTVQDVTELSLARNELQRNQSELEQIIEERTRELFQRQEMFRRFFEVIPDVYMVTDMDDGTCISVNEGFCSATGYSRSEVLGKSAIGLRLWQDSADRKRLVRGIVSDGFVTNLSAEFRRKDSSVWPGIVSACVVELGDRNLILSSTKDVTELRAARDEAIQSNGAKSEFLSSMSHELRTSLNAVMGFAQVLQFNRKEPLTPKQKRAVDLIFKSSQHLLDLINQVLDLSRIESGNLGVSIEVLNPGTIIEDCIAAARTMGESRGIKVDYPPGGCCYS